MPIKIGFQVVASTGEDERFRANELNHHGPTVRGWRSSINCAFPQEIILQLKVLAILQQIQILAHQYLIPQKIEICTSCSLDNDAIYNSRDFFEYLGFITFSDNKATGYRSRELKSILIPSKKAKYIKLRIHNNHVNARNVYNQVGLMAVNVLGSELHGRAEDVEMNNNISFNPTGPYASKFTYNSNYMSPFDDLAFEMSVDEETARIIKIIEHKMLQAISEERLDYANALKITLENLRAAGEILGIYEQEKRRAINMEDFDRAKSKKIQIDHFRQRIYSTLRIDKLLDQADFLEGYDLNSNADDRPIKEGTPRTSPRRHLTNGIDENRTFDCIERSPSRLLRPKVQNPLPLSHSQSQTFPDPSQPPPFSTSISNPHLHHYLQQFSTISETCHEPEYKLDASMDHVRSPSSPSDSLATDSTPPKTPPEPKRVHKWNGSLIPRRNKKTGTEGPGKSPPPPADDWGVREKMKTSLSEQKIRGKAPNVQKSSFEAYEDRMLPALRSYHGHEVVRECQLAFEQRKSTLNEREKKQAMLPIAVFGIELIEKFYSKSFSDKEEGLKQLQQELKSHAKVNEEGNEAKVPTCNKMARAAVFLLHRGVRDTVYSVYKLAAETIRLFFAEFVPERVSSAEVARSVEKLLPELLTKSGDVTPRIHNLAAHTLLSMAECEEVRRLNIIPTQLSRPLTSSVHPRLALSRLEMVEQLILNHGISKDKKSGLTCRTLAEFGSSGLHHPAEAVRKVSERILIHVYKVNPRIVRKQLPPDDNVTRRNLLYRQLFQEFDFMDVQRRLNEQTLEDSMTGFENSEFLSPQKLKAGHELPNGYSVSSEGVESKTTIRYSSEPPTETVKHFQNGRKDKSPYRKGQELKSEVSPSRREEKRVKTSGNVTAVKFPSLTDSIRTTKARKLLEQKKNPLSSRTEQNEASSLSNSTTKARNRRDGQPSGIPVPTFATLRKLPAHPTKKSEKKPQEQSAPKLPKAIEEPIEPKNPTKTIRIRMFDVLENGKLETDVGKPRENDVDQRETEMEESVKFSDSMLASIRENEFMMSSLFNGRDDAEEKLKMCIFCLTTKKWTNKDSLNRHYLTNCLMLTTCEYCMEVTEISGFTNHLLDDCKWKNIFQKCVNCQEAILKDLYNKHECTGKAHKSRCPFCHKSIGDEESSWRKHLMGTNTCPNHPRQK